jgi:hypothetical protein
MKLLDYIFLLIICAGIIYYVFFPNVVVDSHTEFLPGDTTEIVINQKKFDSLEYHFKALKIFSTVQEAFYLDEWFYSTVALFALLLNLL